MNGGDTVNNGCRHMTRCSAPVNVMFMVVQPLCCPEGGSRGAAAEAWEGGGCGPWALVRLTRTAGEGN